jgi:hypothetical protein
MSGKGRTQIFSLDVRKGGKRTLRSDLGTRAEAAEYIKALAGMFGECG